MQRMERDARAGHGRENGRQLEPSGTTGIPATHGRHTPRRSLSAAPEGKNKRQSPSPSTPATMLAMTSCCRTRFVLWEIFARDLACRRNIVAGGGGKNRFTFIFSLRGLKVGILSRRRLREAASMILPLRQWMLACGPSLREAASMRKGDGGDDCRLFFPSGAFGWASFLAQDFEKLRPCSLMLACGPRFREAASMTLP